MNMENQLNIEQEDKNDENPAIILFGIKVRILGDDGNTDSCSECVFGKEDKCPVFLVRNICQDVDGSYNRHFVKVED